MPPIQLKDIAEQIDKNTIGLWTKGYVYYTTQKDIQPNQHIKDFAEIWATTRREFESNAEGIKMGSGTLKCMIKRNFSSKPIAEEYRYEISWQPFGGQLIPCLQFLNCPTGNRYFSLFQIHDIYKQCQPTDEPHKRYEQFWQVITSNGVKPSMFVELKDLLPLLREFGPTRLHLLRDMCGLVGI